MAPAFRIVGSLTVVGASPALGTVGPEKGQLASSLSCDFQVISAPLAPFTVLSGGSQHSTGVSYSALGLLGTASTGGSTTQLWHTSRRIKYILPKSHNNTHIDTPHTLPPVRHSCSQGGTPHQTHRW